MAKKLARKNEELCFMDACTEPATLTGMCDACTIIGEADELRRHCAGIATRLEVFLKSGGKDAKALREARESLTELMTELVFNKLNHTIQGVTS